VGHRGEPFAQQRDRLVGAAGTARISLAQENRSEPVGDVEVRIERRRDVEQRIQQVVLASSGHRSLQPGPAVVLNRADPVDVGCQAVEPERQPLHHVGGAHVENLGCRLRGAGVPAISSDLQRDRSQQRRRDPRKQERVAAAYPHLKSLREKMKVPVRRSAAM
jgi:hypothetical protein